MGLLDGNLPVGQSRVWGDTIRAQRGYVVPANRKHHAIDTATAGRWKLLGRLFRKRRVELGYRYRPGFAEARLPRTAQGNLMIRALNAIENGERPGTYTDETMAMYARAYDVTEESVYAVLEGKADKLDPAPPAVLPVAPGLPPPPQESQLIREADVRPYADPIWLKLMELRDRGIPDPSGDQLGLPSFYAKVWDDSAGAMLLSDRVWLVGTVLRNAAVQDAARQPDADSA